EDPETGVRKRSRDLSADPGRPASGACRDRRKGSMRPPGLPRARDFSALAIPIDRPLEPFAQSDLCAKLEQRFRFVGVDQPQRDRGGLRRVEADLRIAIAVDLEDVAQDLLDGVALPQ